MGPKYLMFPYTLDSHFTFGYGDGVFNADDKSPDKPLWCKYSRCTREPGTFREEAVLTAKKIADDAAKINRIPYLMLSGGLDSEVMVKAFIEAGVEFKVITFRFAQHKNEHELRHVRKFAADNKLDVLWLDIDALEFIKTDEAAKLFNEAHTASFGLVSHMKLMNHIWFELGGVPVLGNGDVYLEKIDGVWKYVELEYMLSWFRHAIKNQILGGIGFFQYTPEITLAMLREPKIERLGRNQDPYATKAYETSRYIKYAIYLKHWPELKIRPKFGGQEFVREQFTERALELLKDRADPFVSKFVLSYDDFRSMMEPDETAYRQDAARAAGRTASRKRAGS